MVKIAGREYPTPLVVGGVTAVGILAASQLLRGGSAGADEATAGPQGSPLAPGASPVGDDVFSQQDLGQFPSAFYPPAGGGGDSGAGWWDDQAPPPSAPPVNSQPPPTTLPPTPVGPSPSSSWYPANLGPPPAGTSGYVAVRGDVWIYTVSGGRITGRALATGAAFSAFVGPSGAYPWPGHGTYTLVKLLSGSRRGKYVPKYGGAVRFVAKP